MEGSSWCESVARPLHMSQRHAGVSAFGSASWWSAGDCSGFDNSLRTAVAPFLQYPTVSICVREVSETCVIPARRIEPRGKTSVPGVDGELVSNRTDLDTVFEQAPPRRLE